MQKILIKIFIILVAILVIDRSFTYFFKKKIFEKTISGEGGGSINYIIEKKNNIDFLVMGSSRAKYQINPALLTNVYNGNGYNAGINGVGGIIYNSMLLHILINKGVTPKAIILQTDIFFFREVKNESLSFEISALYPFIGEVPALKSFVDHNAGFAENTLLLLHSYRFNGNMLSILFNYLKHRSVADNNGFESLQGTIVPNQFDIINRVNKKYEYSTIKLNALAEIIETCKKNNIMLYVVFAPYFKTTDVLQEENKVLTKILREHGNNKLLDFSDIYKIPSLQSSSLWKDENHLNSTGAGLFSKMLNDSLPVAR